jgi:hypothetical protein
MAQDMNTDWCTLNDHNTIHNNQTGNHILSHRFRVLLLYSKSVLSTGAQKCRGPMNSTFNNFVNRCYTFRSCGPSSDIKIRDIIKTQE